RRRLRGRKPRRSDWRGETRWRDWRHRRRSRRRLRGRNWRGVGVRLRSSLAL
ncbi:hypothetical protein LTR95_005213, partial [Oleoguttula sp. CCFEE 5521]